MKKTIKKKKKKHWIALWLVCAVIAVSSIVVYASYIGANNKMKRVVVATTNSGKMFSSDWIYEGGVANKIRRTKYFSVLSEEQKTAGETYNVDVHVYNYNSNNPKKHYSTNIVYKMVATLVDTSGTPINAGTIGGRSIVIPYTDSNGNSQTITLNASNLSGETDWQTLVASSDETETSQKTYQLKFSNNWDLDNDTDICVQLEARLNTSGNTYLDIVDLGGIIGIGKNNAGASTGWTGSVKENTTGADVSDYDAFNFILIGSGKATITFEWDTTNVAVNKYFYDATLRKINFGTGEVTYTAPGYDEDNPNWAKLVINADSGDSEVNNKRNRYEFQIYKVGGYKPEDFQFINILYSQTLTASKTGYAATCTIKAE